MSAAEITFSILMIVGIGAASVFGWLWLVREMFGGNK